MELILPTPRDSRLWRPAKRIARVGQLLMAHLTSRGGHLLKNTAGTHLSTSCGTPGTCAGCLATGPPDMQVHFGTIFTTGGGCSNSDCLSVNNSTVSLPYDSDHPTVCGWFQNVTLPGGCQISFQFAFQGGGLAFDLRDFGGAGWDIEWSLSTVPSAPCNTWVNISIPYNPPATGSVPCNLVASPPEVLITHL
jgi:hypothetical protein